MIDRQHDLSITKQVEALGISRSSVYYVPRPVPAADLAIMRRMDELHLDLPFAGEQPTLCPPILAFVARPSRRRAACRPDEAC